MVGTELAYEQNKVGILMEMDSVYETKSWHMGGLESALDKNRVSI